MKDKLTLSLLLISLVLIRHPSFLLQQAITHIFAQSFFPASRGLCTSVCLDNDDHCVFGTNMDNSLESGYLFVNKRHVLKTTWDPSTLGEYARWISRYGSVTVNFVSYQMVWGGMNEAGLMISTMSLNRTQGPNPDERPPFQSPFWMQYQLDMHSTVDQVITSDSEIRLPESQIDHYLVCDRTGACAVTEFLEGRLVHYTGASLPVKALTNSTYEISLQAREEIDQGGGEGYGNSIQRFVAAAGRLSEFASSDAEEAVDYAFDTLKAVSREDTVWSFVYDPANLRVYFRSNRNPQIRSLDFADLDFSCRTPVRLLDVHANVSGDISDDLVAYSHSASLAHGIIFFTQYEGFSMSPFLVDTLLRGVESFPCQEGEISSMMDLERYHPLIPPTIIWAGLTVLHRLWPVWTLLLGLSLACLLWLVAADKQITMSKRLLWVLVTVGLGPLGLLIYLVARQRRRRAVKAA
jgi:penicillin V acylase-like amidase (Ntn superfamily)